MSLQALTVLTVGHDVVCTTRVQQGNAPLPSDSVQVDYRFNICAFPLQHDNWDITAGICTTDIGGPLTFRLKINYSFNISIFIDNFDYQV